MIRDANGDLRPVRWTDWIVGGACLTFALAYAAVWRLAQLLKR